MEREEIKRKIVYAFMDRPHFRYNNFSMDVYNAY